MLRGKDVHEVEQMKQMGLSVSAISKLTGYDRKTVRKYLLNPEGVPDYVPRVAEPSKSYPHKPFLADRLKAGVWNARCATGNPPTRLWRRLHDPEGLVASPADRRVHRGGAPLRDAARQTSTGGLGTPG